ncbi:hypothetical protein FA15DRAFT_662396 [Coprinopsis marcescibilis]|uniref:Uncharacterized protein n=1 Tax=Coprinopsis marcescibilis TaxID=230819 RepID=A0A5C3LDA4_COPMA|nr:hypothetical protein FA15DRAFT_662396 [Coprinopsis marcescibilis]
MLSMYSQSTPFTDNFQTRMKTQDSHISSLTLSSFQDAIEPFTKQVLKRHETSTRLLCTIPTWGSSPDNCWDLHDLQNLRSKFLVFVHELLKSLQEAGMEASYSLAPSSSCQGIICALPSNISLNRVVIDEVEKIRQTKSESVLLLETQAGPCLIIS